MRNKIQKMMLAILMGACLGLVGCESDDNDDSRSSSTGITQLVGRYALVGFTIISENGVIVTHNDMLGQYSGKMTIDGNGSAVQSTTTLGATVVVSGTMSDITSTSLTLTDNGTGLSYPITYLMEGNTLTITEHANNGFQETDIWQKI